MAVDPQKQREAAIITAAGDLARSGRYPFEGIIAALEKAGFSEARAVLTKPHLSSELARVVESATSRAKDGLKREPPRRRAWNALPRARVQHYLPGPRPRR